MKKIIIVVSLLILCSIGGASAWYDGFDYRIPITIDNTGNPALEDYQFNVSFSSGINETSIRVVNDTDYTIIPHWCENETWGLCYELWFNVSVESEVNTDYYIYYGNDSLSSTSDYDNVFTKTYNNTGLVLELHMDEGTGFSQTNDSSGEGNHGTLTNMNTTGNATSGWQGTDGGQWDGRSDVVFLTGDRLQFDGADDYVNCGNDTSLTPSEITVSTWFKKDIDHVGTILGSTWADTTKTDFTMFVYTNNRLYFDVGNGTTSGRAYFGVGEVNTGWNHAVGIYDGTTVSLYLNGVKSTNAGALTGSISRSGEPLRIGTFSGLLNYFNGSTDELRIYNRSLSEEEIYRQYIRSKYAVDAPAVTKGETETADVIITLHSSSPCCIFTNYTGLVEASYIVKSNPPLNYSSLAFLMGVNHTPTGDMHAYLKPPANDIADGVYRAHNRNNSPYLSWEYNNTISEGNVWQWAGGDNDSFWITKSTINATHTWINITGIASNVFPSMFYLDRNAMYSAPKTGFEINQHQGIIIKTWDLEQLRGRSNDYYISMWFDTMLESTAPTENLEIWYCNNTFDPLTDDPALVCDRKDSWAGSRWMDHEEWQPHNNVSYCKPLVISADISTCSCPPTDINYIYITSETLTSKSYILNATNYDPGITNITYAQTKTMWLYNEISGTSTPVAYTPSFYMTFVRDYEEFLYHLYIANDQGVWGHSDINNISIGIADALPTHCIYNYYWWNGTTDYNMTGTYADSFWVNLTYGYDPDNGAALTHVLSLYDDDYNFVSFINDSLIGNQTDDDVFFDIADCNSGYYKLKVVSTDNEGSTSVSWSKTFELKIRHPFLEGAYRFYDEMEDGLTDFRDGMGRYLVWGIIFFAVGLAFALFTKIKETLIGGK